MKKNKFVRIVATVACLLVPLPLTAESEGKHLFILSGQSNMRKPLPDAFKKSVETVFGEEKVVVATVAHPSQPIKQWYKNWKPPAGMVDERAETNGSIYDKMIPHVRKSLRGAPIKSVTYVWMQGEADAKAGWGSVYEASFFGVLDQLKEDLEIEEINFVVGRINDFWLDPDQFPDGKLLREIQVKLGEENANGAWIDTDDLNRGVNPWGGYSLCDGHFPPPSYRIMGKRFAKAACKLIDPGMKVNEETFAEAFFDGAGDVGSHVAISKELSASVPPFSGSLEVLTDGAFAPLDPKDKGWVGFAPSDEAIEIVLDLGKVMRVEMAGVQLLFGPVMKADFPSTMTISTSPDGEAYLVNGSRYNKMTMDKNSRQELMKTETPLLIVTEQKNREAPDGVQARYVKVSFETGKNWIYFDEFIVNPSLKN